MNKSAILALSAGGGLLSVTLALLPLTDFPGFVFFPFFIPLPLFLLGLGFGIRPLVKAGIFASFLFLLFENSLLSVGFFSLFFIAGPLFLVHRALLRCKKSSGEIVWSSSSFLLRDLTLFSGIIMIIVLGIYLGSLQEGSLQNLAENIFATMNSPDLMPDTFTRRLAIKLVPFLPGIFTFSWMLMMTCNAILAQVFLKRLAVNIRPTPSFYAIQLPKSFLMTFGLALLLSFVGVGTLGLLGKNAALTLAFPFFLGGLALVHNWFHKTTFAKIGLVIFYCTLLLFVWIVLFVVFLGILKPWIEKPSSAN